MAEFEAGETIVTEISTTEIVEVTSEVKEEEEDVGQKVFVGNLSFQTTEEELSQYFSTVGKVLKANIITRGTRSLGYGFVAFETLDEAEKATQELDKKELGGREINVEIAKPKGSNPREGGPRRRSRGSRSRGNEDQISAPSRRPHFRRRRAHSDSEKKDGEGEGEAPLVNGEAGEDAPRGGRRPRGRGGRRPRGRGRGRGNRSGSRRRSSGGGRPLREGQEPGEPSKTTVFVANLPFATNDEGLQALFKDYNIKSAHVVKRRSGRSKGFGFVDLVDEEEQQKVLEGMKNVVTEGRELVIKIALSEPHVFADQKPHMVEEEQKPAEAIAPTVAIEDEVN